MKNQGVKLGLLILSFFIAGCSNKLDLKLLETDGKLVSYVISPSGTLSEDAQVNFCNLIPSLPKSLSRPLASNDDSWLLGFYRDVETKNLAILSPLLFSRETAQAVTCKGDEFTEALDFYQTENKEIIRQTPYEIAIYDMKSCSTTNTILSTAKTNRYRGVSWNPRSMELAYGISLNFLSENELHEVHVYNIHTHTNSYQNSGIAPSWSADGYSLAYITADGVSVLNQSERRQISIPIGSVDLSRKSLIHWSPDGSKLLVSLYIEEFNSNSKAGVFIINLENQELIQIITDGSEALWFPNWICE